MSLISAELACALPYDGGLVAWVDEVSRTTYTPSHHCCHLLTRVAHTPRGQVCGKTIGAHNMYWLWLSYIFDSCAYPVLASSYVGSIQQLDLALLGYVCTTLELASCVGLSLALPHAAYELLRLRDRGNEETGEKLVACIIVGLITLIKLGGTDYIVKASSIFFFFSMTPAVIFMVYGSKDLKPSVLTDTTISDETGGLQPATLFSWISWLYCGYNSLGALAGEVSWIPRLLVARPWLFPFTHVTIIGQEPGSHVPHRYCLAYPNFCHHRWVAPCGLDLGRPQSHKLRSGPL